MKSTFLKVMSIIVLVFGIIAALVTAGMLAMGGMVAGMMGAAGIGMNDVINAAAEAGAAELGQAAAGLATLISVALVFSVIEAIVMIVGGALGIGASGNVAKAGRCVIMGIIMIIMAVISLIISGMAGSIMWTSILSFILPILYFLAAFMFKKKGASAAA